MLRRAALREARTDRTGAGARLAGRNRYRRKIAAPDRLRLRIHRALVGGSRSRDHLAHRSFGAAHGQRVLGGRAVMSDKSRPFTIRHVAGAEAPPWAVYDADVVILALERAEETVAAINSALGQVGVSR